MTAPASSTPSAQPDTCAPSAPAQASARRAGLVYVAEAGPGISRRRCGKGFCYFAVDGQRVRDSATLARIRSLALPPAWRDVWISPHPDSHLQAWGVDERGRRQYRYHPDWVAERDRGKFERLLAFGHALPDLRAAIERDLARPGLSRTRVVAAMVDLLDKTFMRVGNTDYARRNRSYGLTTLRDRHVRIEGATLTFEFRGKSGVQQRLQVTDRRLARIVQRCHDLPGQELFQYNEGGTPQTVGSADINAYLHDAMGEGFTAKDFRTWHATLEAARALLAAPPPCSPAAARRTIASAMDSVARLLGNTRTVCRNAYVHPAIPDAYAAGELHARLGLPPDAPAAALTEAALLGFLASATTSSAAPAL